MAKLDISGKEAPVKANETNNTVENGDSDDDEAEEGEGEGAGEGAAKKKKKRKPRKKKKAGGGAAAQSSPPRTEVSKLFPNHSYPIGEEVDYLNDNAYRTTDEEKRALDREDMNQEFLKEYRQAAETHRQVRKYAQQNIKPGMTLTEIAEMIENGTRALTGHQGLEEGDNIRAASLSPRASASTTAPPTTPPTPATRPC